MSAPERASFYTVVLVRKREQTTEGSGRRNGKQKSYAALSYGLCAVVMVTVEEEQ